MERKNRLSYREHHRRDDLGGEHAAGDLGQLALLVFSFSLCASLVWVVIIVFYIYLSRHEEKLLIEKFGDEYKRYMKQVPMFLPRLRKRPMF